MLTNKRIETNGVIASLDLLSGRSPSDTAWGRAGNLVKGKVSSRFGSRFTVQKGLVKFRLTFNG